MTNHTLLDFIQEAYPEIEIDEPTEAEWDEHTLAGLEDLDMDSFAATPEREI